MGTQTKYTEAELMALPKNGQKYELVNGELVMSPAGVFDHGDIISWLSAKLAIYSREKKLGVIVDGQSGFWMKSGNLRSPDISFMGRDRLKALTPRPQGFVNGAPDLAVEVLSPSDTVMEVGSKIAELFENGTRLAWVVNPREKSVLVYHGATPDRLLKPGDQLDGELVLPGFAMPVAELFDQPKFD
jgi:Uma2 family endonuclease